jgi:hypothetical protein
VAGARDVFCRSAEFHREGEFGDQLRGLRRTEPAIGRCPRRTGLEVLLHDTERAVDRDTGFVVVLLEEDLPWISSHHWPTKALRRAHCSGEPVGALPMYSLQLKVKLVSASRSG